VTNEKEIAVAWANLEYLVDKGFAVAFRKTPDNKCHVRAVMDGQIVEETSAAMSDAIVMARKTARRTKKVNLLKEE